MTHSGVQTSAQPPLKPHPRCSAPTDPATESLIRGVSGMEKQAGLLPHLPSTRFWALQQPWMADFSQGCRKLPEAKALLWTTAPCPLLLLDPTQLQEQRILLACPPACWAGALDGGSLPTAHCPLPSSRPFLNSAPAPTSPLALASPHATDSPSMRVASDPPGRGHFHPLPY